MINNRFLAKLPAQCVDRQDFISDESWKNLIGRAGAD